MAADKSTNAKKVGATKSGGKTGRAKKKAAAIAMEERTDRGDSTLIGTHVQLITEHVDGTPVFKFQISSAVGLQDADTAGLVQRNLQTGSSDGLFRFLRAAATTGIDKRFSAVLNALLTPHPDGLEGRGGQGNLRLISDSRTHPPTQTFELHTVVTLDDATAAAELADALPRKNVDEIMTILNDKSVVLDEFRLKGMLHAVLND